MGAQPLSKQGLLARIRTNLGPGRDETDLVVPLSGLLGPENPSLRNFGQSVDEGAASLGLAKPTWERLARTAVCISTTDSIAAKRHGGLAVSGFWKMNRKLIAVPIPQRERGLHRRAPQLCWCASRGVDGLAPRRGADRGSARRHPRCLCHHGAGERVALVEIQRGHLLSARASQRSHARASLRCVARSAPL